MFNRIVIMICFLPVFCFANFSIQPIKGPIKGDTIIGDLTFVIYKMDGNDWIIDVKELFLVGDCSGCFRGFYTWHSRGALVGPSTWNYEDFSNSYFFEGQQIENLVFKMESKQSTYKDKDGTQVDFRNVGVNSKSEIAVNAVTSWKFSKEFVNYYSTGEGDKPQKIEFYLAPHAK
jgi:hypothetical protein